MCIDSITHIQDSVMTFVNPFTGNYSMRLGNDLIMDSLEELDFKFQVQPTDTMLTYFYAAIMQDPGHLPDQQPYLKVFMFDSSNNPIAQGCDSFYSNQPNVPFIVSGKGPMLGTRLLYRRWTPVTVNLGAYVGQNIKVQFINSDCELAGHFGYSYIDGSCMSNPIANVWPGDCNYDMTCDFNDLFGIGIAYGAIGTVRTSASNTWIAQPSSNWANHFPLGANYKHADCNGDGLVDLNDTLAIVLNYGMNHPPRMKQPKNGIADPKLILIPAKSTILPGDDVDIDIMLGDASLPVSSIYGLKFKLNFDQSLTINNTQSTSLNGCWLGVKNTDLVSLINTSTAGSIDYGMVKNTHSNVTGYGLIGHLHFKTPSNIPLSTKMKISFSDVKAVTNNWRDISLNVIDTIITFGKEATGISSITNNESVTVYNTPGTNQISISTNQFVASSISLINAVGQVVETINSPNWFTTFDTNELPNGIYFISIKTPQQQNIVRKVEVVK